MRSELDGELNLAIGRSDANDGFFVLYVDDVVNALTGQAPNNSTESRADA